MLPDFGSDATATMLRSSVVGNADNALPHTTLQRFLVVDIAYARPKSSSAAPDMTALVVRPETAEDDAFLRRLTIEGRWAEFAPLPLADAHKRMLLEQQYEARRHHYRTYYIGADFSVIELDGVAVGRLCLLRGARDHNLVDIALLPEHCGKGLGGALLDTIIAEAAQLGRSVSLRVEHTNPARRLYESKGFRETERSEIDAVMEWRA